MMEETIFLVQTDTTVGFLCKNQEKLNAIKKRDINTPCIKVVSRFEDLKNLVHVPNKYKNFIRKAKKTTFIYPNKKSIRVVKDNLHEYFLEKYGPMYSTSANITHEHFDEKTARNLADIVVENDNGFFEKSPSKIYKINKIKCIKLRS